jgi:hypothetical protein
MNSYVLAVLLTTLALCPTASAARLDCSELQAEIEGKLQSRNVGKYVLEIVDANAPTTDRIIGRCDGGKKKIVYFSAPAKVGAGIQFDGLYRSPAEVDSGGASYTYLRFYPDGTVLMSGSNGPPAYLRYWFCRENNSGSNERGRYKLTHDRIRLSVFAGGNPLSERIDYAGKIEGGGLRLASYSYLTDYKSNPRLFEFWKWTNQVINDPRLERQCDDAPGASGVTTLK